MAWPPPPSPQLSLSSVLLLLLLRLFLFFFFFFCFPRTSTIPSPCMRACRPRTSHATPSRIRARLLDSKSRVRGRSGVTRPLTSVLLFWRFPPEARRRDRPVVASAANRLGGTLRIKRRNLSTVTLGKSIERGGIRGGRKPPVNRRTDSYRRDLSFPGS